MLVETILVLVVGLLPSLLSLVVIQKANQRWQNSLRRQRFMASQRPSMVIYLPANYEDLEVYAGFIGEASCRFNARSPYLRCAVNPEGPCETCRHYEAR